MISLHLSIGSRSHQAPVIGIQLSHPLGSEDPPYLPPIEAAVINTKRQAIAALEVSYKLTGKFWNTWQTQYLTALREKHTREVSHKKGCSQTPEVGTLVLICDSLQPRHSWKDGVIHPVIANIEGKIREVVVRLPSQRLIRRPVNLLVPWNLMITAVVRKKSRRSPNQRNRHQQNRLNKETNQTVTRQY
ncbi:hypothetical protein RB195_022824 [Necator americanus]|uniref:DUF5641 domain-containing protein n=1 Tax=Necator americanus TaxID=51031 RepID=A0ABR1EGX9_NECAM